MSIFGSLGLVSAGYKTLAACFTYGNFEGAMLLGNMGFEPQGENLSLIMVEAGKGKKRYIIETRMDQLIKELNIDKNRITGVSHKSAAWNVKMMATTAFFCAFSITPYIYMNLVPNNLNTITRWLFPVLRATGGFTTATFIQLLIQQRITTLSKQYLVKQDPPRNADVEAMETKKHRMDVHTKLLVWPLLFGIIASVVGYIGCFSVVQNSTTTFGPISWLCLEAGLSLMRLAIWAWNPTKDDAPPLEIILKLDKQEPLPTCNKYNEDILEYSVLPLTRARDFLKMITSFAGLIKPFGNPDLSLYYTLTRRRPSKKNISRWNRDNEPENAEEHKHGERTLFITVFDHKERTTRVFTRDNDMDIFYSTNLDAPLVDVGHFLLEVEIDAEIDHKGDPVYCDINNLDSLRNHHRSILEHIQYRLGTADVSETYAIENSWTMKVEDTISTLQRLREENGDDWERNVEKGKDTGRGRTEESLASDYFMHSSIERERELLDEKRVKWIERRMEMLIKETKEGFQGGMGVDYRVNNQAVEKKPAPKPIEGRERHYMELLLVCEVREWEQLFWNKFKAFLEQIGSDRVEEKERLTREWRTNCWKRLDPQMDAALERMAEVDDMDHRDYFLESLGKQWELSISRFFEGVEEPGLIKLSKLMTWINEGIDDDERIEMRLRMENEVEDTKFRLERGSELGRFDQFWDDNLLFECRYSQSKWLYFSQIFSPLALEIYSHALKRNKNITHITFWSLDDDQIQDIICDLPWVTSISLYRESSRTPPFHRDLLFIKSSNNDLTTFAKEITGKLDSSSTYSFLDFGYRDPREYYPPSVRGKAKVLISFVAPASGKSLTLRVKHSGREDGPLEVALGSTKIQLNPSSKSSLTIDDITLYPIQVPGPSESDHLEFEPEVRNDIVIQFRETDEEHGHILQDVVLLDEAGLEYMPYSASSTILSN